MSNSKNENIKIYAKKIIFASDNQELKSRIELVEIINKIEFMKKENYKLERKIKEIKLIKERYKLEFEEENRQKSNKR